MLAKLAALDLLKTKVLENKVYGIITSVDGVINKMLSRDKLYLFLDFAITGCVLNSFAILVRIPIGIKSSAVWTE